MPDPVYTTTKENGVTTFDFRNQEGMTPDFTSNTILNFDISSLQDDDRILVGQNISHISFEHSSYNTSMMGVQMSFHDQNGDVVGSVLLKNEHFALGPFFNKTARGLLVNYNDVDVYRPCDLGDDLSIENLERLDTTPNPSPYIDETTTYTVDLSNLSNMFNGASCSDGTCTMEPIEIETNYPTCSDGTCSLPDEIQIDTTQIKNIPDPF